MLDMHISQQALAWILSYLLFIFYVSSTLCCQHIYWEHMHSEKWFQSQFLLNSPEEWQTIRMGVFWIKAFHLGVGAQFITAALLTEIYFFINTEIIGTHAINCISVVSSVCILNKNTQKWCAAIEEAYAPDTGFTAAQYFTNTSAMNLS